MPLLTGVAFDDAEGFLFIDLEPEGWPSRDASSGVDRLLLASPASRYKRLVCDSRLFRLIAEEGSTGIREIALVSISAKYISPERAGRISCPSC